MLDLDIQNRHVRFPASMGATASLEIFEPPKERRNNVPHGRSSDFQ